ncbi:phage tail protein [Hymenobacter sp. GOD-10R]|uniref:phage tail protein n=1 Tax=Hymenobacter sp. GOD-10R TaxID=3093922 RepID=UPI002D79CA45|nr:tail fiber protein [Hymenobacter sp. GOD-10R]WRQ30684.1 tail fiber protein [Hymenobacter sp. GOD-10R]
MSTPYLGEVRAVGFDFAPRGWATCNGQQLSINDNSTLFQLLGTTYGGDGVNTFNLPNLNGTVIVGAGAGGGLSNYPLGQRGGTATVTLTTNQLATHGHSISGSLAGSTGGTPTDDPVGHLPGQLAGSYNPSSSPSATLNVAALTGTTTVAGSGQAHPNLQPSLALNYIIAVDGLFPPHN